ncbi:hypothetical protein FH039_00615 [Thermococcus indicus]|uniref:Uncharacterized protein n=1 Tax=Thermococcus indicus TaxID=2586643 RepID=A0A4Y5SI39_9EURY|nr:hypothetical protein [Thermococcus indicus]QDA30413.1 hypothetical protein FH039_00615 [Thermococcus indicus]
MVVRLVSKAEFSVSDVAIKVTPRGRWNSLKDDGLKINRVRIVVSRGEVRLVLMEKTTTTARKRRKLGPVKLPFLKKEYSMEVASKSKWVLRMPRYFSPDIWYVDSTNGKKSNLLVIEGSGVIQYVHGGIERIQKVYEEVPIYGILFYRTSAFCSEDEFPLLTRVLSSLVAQR